MNNTFYLECSDQKHHKFYEVTLSFPMVLVTYGRIGRAGRVNLKQFPTTPEALQFIQKQLQQKLKRGYHPSFKGFTEARTRDTNQRQLRIPFL